MRVRTTRLTPVLIAVVAAGLAPARGLAQDARVTVVSILATDRNQDVDAKLKEVAKEVQKREPNLRGFRLGTTTCKELNVGQKEVFDLIREKASADVKLLAKNDSKERVTIEVKPPRVGAITYETCYDKFFPIVTRYLDNGEQLIVAVMVKKPEAKKAP